MIETVLETINKNKMFNKGDKVILAVSGGPDSLCMLHVLCSLKDKLGISLYVAHVNHGLRGQESDEDEKFVENFCKKINVVFRSIKVDINKVAAVYNLSCETAGRKVRYEFFEKLKCEFIAQKIAVAHNANDQAETMLMRIMRGTGLEGLTGIKAVRDGIFVRPLINVTRKQIEKYCIENDLCPRIDKTNFEQIYSRNKIRLKLIPYMEKNFNKDIIGSLNRLSSTIMADNSCLNSISKEKFKKYCDITPEKVIISKEAFLEEKSIISRILRMALHRVCGTLKNFEKVHIVDIIQMQNHSTGKRLMLPNNIIVLSQYGNIIVKKNNSVDKSGKYSYALDFGTNNIEKLKLNIKIKKTSKCSRTNNKFVQFFDFDKLKGSITIRNRQKGDKFIPLGMSGKRKLKDFFMDLKIPRSERENIPLICFGEDIGWVVGYRISDDFKVDRNTKNILAISFEREEL